MYDLSSLVIKDVNVKHRIEKEWHESVVFWNNRANRNRFQVDSLNQHHIILEVGMHEEIEMQ